MSLSDTTLCEAFQLGPFTVPRLWTGLWQLSSTAWGSASAAKIRQGMMRHYSHGFTAFALRKPVSALKADHYGGSEILFGQFRESLPPPQRAIGATKWCVFKPTDPSRAVVEAAVRERLTRMRSSSVDLLQVRIAQDAHQQTADTGSDQQFHWQDYSDKGYMTALRQLQDLQREGLITTLGLCNFDTARTDEICTQLGPGAIVSNQVQFSLIDTRPLHGMADVCEKHGIKLLTYGSMCGGFLADAWLQQPEPDPYSGALTPSQRKYLDVIMKAWGDWPLFQELLGVLRSVGDRHDGASIANVAARWVLDHPFVGAVLVGTRLGVSEHPDDNRNVFRFALTEQDRAEIGSGVGKVQRAEDDYQSLGTVGQNTADADPKTIGRAVYPTSSSIRLLSSRSTGQLNTTSLQYLSNSDGVSDSDVEDTKRAESQLNSASTRLGPPHIRFTAHHRNQQGGVIFGPHSSRSIASHPRHA
ncbi:hypothetical protein EVG20_g9499 [Dentipellis fragilis]|uniref:NADP-dependent oxidoreductase domain-containing protein n=1 Tax=Dentipellis fragilis TaxID=205917 RepID=A0A4Y9XXR0_9AGAM|nr:hypothetical protein EVG20_g9499 [Dentipellis fragilis]